MPKLQGGGDVVVVEYDPSWGARYERERASIVEALGDVMDGVAAIEHVGSTAVPGLAAKPIIDIIVGVRELAAGERCVQPLEGIGYMGSRSRSPETRMSFYRGHPDTHHLHIVEHGGEEWQRLIVFRDFLRERPAVAREYDALKKELALQHRTDPPAYAEAKAPFVESVLAKARCAGRLTHG